MELGLFHDTTVRGGRIKTLTVIDEYTRECHALYVDRKITANEVINVMDELIKKRGVPGHIRSDNGPEFISNRLQSWLKDNQINTLYIDPGSPWQNGFVESFHDKFRDECLNRELLWTLSEARVVIEAFRKEYDYIRLHRSLGNATPKQFANQGPVSSRATPSLQQTLNPPTTEIINNN